MGHNNNLLGSLRAFSKGQMNESTLQENLNGNDDDINELLEDSEFMQECMAVAIPMFIQTELLENAINLDEDVKEAFLKVQDFLAGQGIISEAATVSLTNPKINVVRLNKQSQIKRLTTIISLKLARRDNTKSYKKYKLGQKIKKENLAEITKRYGQKAERLAKKLWQKSQKNGKVAAVVEAKKEETKKESSKK